MRDYVMPISVPLKIILDDKSQHKKAIELSANNISADEDCIIIDIDTKTPVVVFDLDRYSGAVADGFSRDVVKMDEIPTNKIVIKGDKCPLPPPEHDCDVEVYCDNVPISAREAWDAIMMRISQIQ